MIRKLKTFYERRRECFGASDGEEQDMRNNTIDDMGDKINEIIEYLNKYHFTWKK